MLVDVYNKDGHEAGQIELPDAIFAIEPNEHAMHQAVVVHLANRRQGTSKTKVRSEVRGGGKKPWRQKGRGTARAGSIRSPLWVGGGTIFGPKPYKFVPRINRKMKALAKKSALSLRNSEKNLVVLEDYSPEGFKTRDIAKLMDNLKLSGEKVIFVLAGPDEKFYFSARNLPKVEAKPVDSISAYEILNHKKVVLMKSAVEKLENTLNKNN
ncbi:MAG: 50S ribosomal protein L4 [Candidatus Kapaibacterium sp.]